MSNLDETKPTEIDVIDNFNVVEDKILRFSSDGGEFYLILVLKRRKDTKGKMVEGVNEDNRLIKHYFVYDREYLAKKKEAIKALCIQNNARAYILPQRRDCRLALWALHDKISETLKGGSMNVHFDHFIRSCVAGMPETSDKSRKRWVIDIDSDDEATRKIADDAIGRREDFFDVISGIVDVMKTYAEWLADMIRMAIVSDLGYDRPDGVEKFMPKITRAFKKDDIVLLKTPHGFHIVTPPFNRDPKAMKGYFGDGCPKSEWIKPDAMALLYAPSGVVGSAWNE